MHISSGEAAWQPTFQAGSPWERTFRLAGPPGNEHFKPAAHPQESKLFFHEWASGGISRHGTACILVARTLRIFFVGDTKISFQDPRLRRFSAQAHAHVSCPDTAYVSCPDTGYFSCPHRAHVSCPHRAHVSCPQRAHVSCRDRAHVSCRHRAHVSCPH